MNPRYRRRIFEAAGYVGPSGDGGGGLTAAQLMTGFAENFSPTGYYNTVWPWINIIHGGGGFQGSSLNAQGYPSGLANGDSRAMAIVFAQDSAYGWFPPGDYQVSGSAGWHFTIDMGSSSGLTNIVQGTSGSPTCTFTVADLGPDGNYGGLNLYVRATNHSGGVATLASIYVGKVSSKSLWDAGEIYDPGFLADLDGVSAVRMQGWVDQNGSLYDAWDTTQLNDEANVVWNNGQGEVPKGNKIPWSVATKLAKKLTETNSPDRPCVLWACVNSGNEGLYFNDYNPVTGIFTAIRTQNAYDTNEQLPQETHLTEDAGVVLYGNAPTGFTNGALYFAHPVTSTTFQLKATSGGSIISGTGGTFTYDKSNWWQYGMGVVPKTADAIAYYTAVANQIKATFPGVKVLVEVSNEPWNFGYKSSFYFGHAASYAADPTGGSYNSAAVGWAWTQQRAWKAFEAVFGRENVVRGTTAQMAWFDPFHPCQTYVDLEGIIEAGTPMGQLSDLHWTDSYTWPSMDGITENSGEHDGLNALFDAGRSTADDATLTADYIRGTTIIAARLASHIAELHTYSPGKPVITYEGGEGSVSNGYTANQAAMLQRIKAYLSSAESVNWVNDFVDRALTANGIKMQTQYTSGGSWTSIYKWGLKRVPQLADTPSSAAMKAKCKLLS